MSRSSKTIFARAFSFVCIVLISKVFLQNFRLLPIMSRLTVFNIAKRDFPLEYKTNAVAFVACDKKSPSQSKTERLLHPGVKYLSLDLTQKPGERWQNRKPSALVSAEKFLCWHFSGVTFSNPLTSFRTCPLSWFSVLRKRESDI